MTTQTTSYAVTDAERPLWVGQTPAAWGDVVRSVDPAEAHDAASMIAAAGLDWSVQQHPLEAVVEREYQSLRVPVPRHVANVRSDTRAVLGVVGEGYEPLQNASAFAFCDAITDSGRAHWIGGGSTRGGARVHALMRRVRGHGLGGAVSACVPERDAASDRGRGAHVEGAPHGERRGEARRRAADARYRLALLRRVGGAGRAVDPRATDGGGVRALSRGPCAAARPDARPDGRRAGRAQRRTGARGDPHRLSGGPRPRHHPRHPVGRVAGRHGVRRSRPADAADCGPDACRGPLRPRDRAAAAQRPSAGTTDGRRDQVMTSTLTTVPLAKIKPREGFNPRSEFADEQMAELVESVKQHGIITPLTLAPDGDGFVIVAGERRYRAAKQAKLKEVPAQVRGGDGDALTLAVAENVIRADLTPVEEAEAYRQLVEEHGDAAKVAKLVGRSEKLIRERLDLLRLPEEARALMSARRVPLACAPALIRIAEREPLLADLTAAWLAEHPAGAGYFPTAPGPGEVVDDVLEAEWQDDDGH